MALLAIADGEGFFVSFEIFHIVLPAKKWASIYQLSEV